MTPTSDSVPKALVLGPMPPPYGGATVSFARAFSYAVGHSAYELVHLNFPVLKGEGTIGSSVSHTRTILALFRAIVIITRVRRVAMFASRGSAFSYGVVILLWCRILRLPFALRLFGGRPHHRLRSVFRPLRTIIYRTLKGAASISLETEVGRLDFPDELRKIITPVTGYRPQPPTIAQTSDRQTFRFVFAGRMDASKGMDTLMSAFGELRGQTERQIELHCFGDTRSTEYEDLDSVDIVLHGSVDNDTYRRLLPDFDVFVYPSRYDNEGHPGAVIEALMCGLPVICTAIPAVEEIVLADHNGLVFEIGDVNGLTAAMKELIEHDALRNRLATGALDSGRAFDEAVVLPRLLTVLGLASIT